MSDDIVDGLKRAGSDEGRPLGFGAAEVLRVGRIRRRRRRVYAGSATALGVAVVAIAAMAIVPQARNGEVAGTPDTVPLDRGPMSEAEAQAALAPGVPCTKNFEDQTIIYARKVDSMSGTAPSVLATARRPDGLLYTCGTSWSFRGGVQPTGPLDRGHPIESITNEGTITTTEDDWLGESGFYWVDDSVERVETRVGTPGGSEPWRVSRPHNGVVFWSAWVDEGAYDADDEVWLQWRAYDTDGNRIDPSLMPDQPQLIDPTGDNRVAAEYDGIRDLVDQVALDRLQTERGHLEGGSARYGSRVDSRWTSVTTHLYWSPWQRTTTARVELSLNRPGTYTDEELRTRIGCQDRFECERVDLGDRGSAWVGENEAGSIGVGYVQPDGEIVYIVIDTEAPGFVEADVAIDITVDDAIDFVTDERLALPRP